VRFPTLGTTVIAFANSDSGGPGAFSGGVRAFATSFASISTSQVHRGPILTESRYQVREQRLAEATGALSEVADRWDRRLQAIKHLAEHAHAADRSIRTDTSTDQPRRTRHD
jgi:hypothetical protein